MIGKGSKTRLVPIGRIACEAINQYLTQERIHLVGRKTGNEVFLSRHGKKLTTQRIWQILKEIAASSADLKSMFIRICCGTLSRRIFWRMGPICGSFKNYSAMRISGRRRSIRMWSRVA